MILKDTKKNRRIFQSFLKERGLNQIYNRYSRLKGRRKKAIMIEVGGEKRPVVAYKNKDRIIFRSPQTLAVVTSTRRIKTLKNVPDFFKVAERDRKSFMGIILDGKRYKDDKGKWQTRKGIIKPQFRRTDVAREIFKNSIHYETLHPLRNKAGKMFIRVRFIGKKKEEYVNEGGSRHLFDLTNADGRDGAFAEAFAGAMEGLWFSYERFEVLWLRFFYKQPKTFEKLIFA